MNGFAEIKDVVYRQAGTGYNNGQGPTEIVPLKLDAYLPIPSDTPTPALVLAHGGAFHRGSKDNDAFSAGTGTSTAIAEYCRRFAALGLAAFSVEYRLAQMDPTPSRDPVLSHPDEVPMSRVTVVREELGLSPIEPGELARFMEAAFDDVTEAIRFVKAHHLEYRIDPGRIVAGGFSAGGRCASYAAYGKKVGVAGVFSLSGPMIPADVETYLMSADGLSAQLPLLMISGEQDLDYVQSFIPEVVRIFRKHQQKVEAVSVPGANHFYSAESRAEDGRAVFDVIHENIVSWVGRPSSQ